jgi:MFS family permease
LIGYYCAARVIDVPVIGRKKLQMASFGICAGLFMTTAAIFDTARSETLMFLYFASSFFGNFGVNVTTYVVAAETYPTELRATCHGLSAFLGKLGALLATILFDSMSTAEIFWACGTVSILGLIVTFIFTVDLTHVSLAELEAQLELFLEGKLARYTGKLNAPQHLSNFEIWTGRHGEYDPLWASKLLGKSSRHRK